MTGNGEIILYQSEDGQAKIQVQLKDETVWLTQAQMAELFQTDRSVITKHINNIYVSGELDRGATCAKIAQVQLEGGREVNRPVDYFNLDAIISVGYRVNSHRGVQFRVWATKTLGEYMVKGFAIDDDRLSGKAPNYFDELIERVRRIRTSEVNFYEKVRDIFATSIDYDPKSDQARTFFATAQNKFHYAITGSTASELIVKRANAYKDNMGVVHQKGKKPTKQEATTAKNYFDPDELKRLELLVDQFLSFAELQSVEHRPMYMADWARKLDGFITLNDKTVLEGAGSVSHTDMLARVGEEYRKFTHRLETGEGTTKDEFNSADGLPSADDD